MRASLSRVAEGDQGIRELRPYNYAMSVAMPNTAFSILSRVVTPDRASLPADTARAFLALNFAAEDVDRMNELAERARAGTLSVEEQDELDQYERIGYLLSLLHSRARISLGNTSAAT